MTRPYIIAITSPSGGGKTALTRRVTESVESGEGFYFDEFDSTNVYPADFCEWHARGADIEEFDCPGMYSAVSDAIDRNTVRCIVLDFPFAREHHRFKDLIDLTVYVDTPLDVAMARRITRDFIDDGRRSACAGGRFLMDDVMFEFGYGEYDERLSTIAETLLKDILVPEAKVIQERDILSTLYKEYPSPADVLKQLLEAAGFEDVLLVQHTPFFGGIEARK